MPSVVVIALSGGFCSTLTFTAMFAPTTFSKCKSIFAVTMVGWIFASMEAVTCVPAKME